MLSDIETSLTKPITAKERFTQLQGLRGSWQAKWLKASSVAASMVYNAFDSLAIVPNATSVLARRLVSNLAHSLTDSLLVGGSPFSITINDLLLAALDEQKQNLIQRKIVMLSAQAKNILNSSSVSTDVFRSIRQMITIGWTSVIIDSDKKRLSVLEPEDIVFQYDEHGDLNEIMRRYKSDTEEHRYHWGKLKGNQWLFTEWIDDTATGNFDQFGKNALPYHVIHADRPLGETYGTSLVMDNLDLIEQHTRLNNSYNKAVDDLLRVLYFDKGSNIDLQKLSNAISGDVLDGLPELLVAWSPGLLEAQNTEYSKPKIDEIEQELGQYFADLSTALPRAGETTLGELMERKAVMRRSVSGLYLSIQTSLMQPLIDFIVTELDEEIKDIKDYVEFSPNAIDDSAEKSAQMDILLNRLANIAQLPEGVDIAGLMTHAVQLSGISINQVILEEAAVNQGSTQQQPLTQAAIQ